MASREELIRSIRERRTTATGDDRQAVIERIRQRRIAPQQAVQQIPSQEDIFQQAALQVRGDQPGVGEGLVALGEAVDVFTGAPVRRAVGGAIGVPTPEGQVAPTGAELAGGLGISEEPALSGLAQLAFPAVPSATFDILAATPQGQLLQDLGPTRKTVAGVALETALDVTNIIPGLGLGKVALKRAKTVGPVLRNASRVILGDGDRIQKLTTRTGDALTGVGKKVIDTYIEKTESINRLIKKIGPDVKGGIQDEVDTLRRDVVSSIGQTKAALNADIGRSLKAAPTERNIKIDGIVDILKDAQLDLVDETLEPGMASDISEIISRIASKGRKKLAVIPGDQELAEAITGVAAKKKLTVKEMDDFIDLLDRSVGEVPQELFVNLNELQSIKNFLQKRAKRAFSDGKGKIFTNAKEVQLAAKRGLRQVNLIMNKLAPQEILNANKQLSKMHIIDGRMNSSLLKEGGAAGVITRVGRDTNPAGKAVLRRIEELTEVKAIERAQEIAAAETFATPQLTPLSGGSTSTTRSIIGSTVGAALSVITGGGPEAGAALGFILTSPATLKVAINTGRFPRSLFRALTGSTKLNEATAQQAFNILATPRGARIVEEFARARGLKPAAREEEDRRRPQ